MTDLPPIKPRERDTIVQALAAGVVPRIGLQHIQVGRSLEVGALIKDIDRIVDGGSSCRFIIGEYGAGKTFFLSLIRLIALERRCVTIHADLAPDRRIHATNGQARGLYAEAIRNMATRTKPDGGALPSVVERFISECVNQADTDSRTVEQMIDARLARIQELVGGHDFAHVLKAYWRGSNDGNEPLKAAALRWLRAEYTTKTEARQALGVRSIIDDADVYDSLKLLAMFVRLAGYNGLVVVFDEMVNIYKLQNAQARHQNFEQILRMVNDMLQGNSEGLGFIFGGTPEFLMDSRRGLYSYEALQSRLAENQFAAQGIVDMTGPVIRLQNLSPEDFLILLDNIRNVFALRDPARHLVPDEALIAFMDHCSRRIGEAYFRTPRNTIKAFVQFLAVLEQNPTLRWPDLIGDLAVDEDPGDNDNDDVSSDDDELSAFSL